jgi:hypothetical protein
VEIFDRTEGKNERRLRPQEENVKKKISSVFSALVMATVLMATAVLPISCTQSQIQTAEQLAGVLLQDVPQLIILFGAMTPAQATTVNSAFAKANQSYALLKQALDDYNTAGPVTTAQKVQFYVAEAQKDLQPVLQIAGANQKLAAGITLALNTASQIAAIFPTTAAASAVKASNRVKLPSPKDVQSQFNEILGPARASLKE